MEDELKVGAEPMLTSIRMEQAPVLVGDARGFQWYPFRTEPCAPQAPKDYDDPSRPPRPQLRGMAPGKFEDGQYGIKHAWCTKTPDGDFEIGVGNVRVTLDYNAMAKITAWWVWTVHGRVCPDDAWERLHEMPVERGGA